MMARRFHDRRDGGQLHYREAGHHALPPLLLLHQSPSSSAMYEELAQHLSREFHVIAPDTPGFGDSDPIGDQPTIGELAAPVIELMAELGHKTFSLFGHHTGASLAVRIASLEPQGVTRLALCGPPVLNARSRRELPSLALRTEPDAGGEHLGKLWLRLRSKDPNAGLELSNRELRLALQAGAAGPAAYAAVAEQAIERQLAALDVPVLVFAGEHDSLVDCLEPAAAVLRHGECEILPGAGTYICETHADWVSARLKRFFLGAEATVREEVQHGS